jgi:hypothetical protein
MKYLLFLLLLSTVACDDKKVEYWIVKEIMIPDSLSSKQAQFVIDVVKAATNNMSTHDYEDVDDTIEQARIEAFKIYSIEVVCLRRKVSGKMTVAIYPHEMTEYEKSIFDKLRAGEKVK